jgi:DNA-binding response OmpR family regulator
MDTPKKTILIVDDDIDYLLQKKIELEGEGYKVVTAEGRSKSREILKTLTPDLAIIDLMMEDQDAGFVLAYELKRQFPTLPVIMVTAVTSQTGLEFDSVTDGEKSWIKADTVLTKPVRIEQLLREITRFLGE